MTTTETTNSIVQPSHLNANSNYNNPQPEIHQPTRNNVVDHPNDSNMPRDANLFSRSRNPESRQDPFGSTLTNLISNRVRESPLLSLFVPRESNNSPDDNSRSNSGLFNRNGNNVLGNLISNGLNRLLSLRNSRNSRRLDLENGNSSNELNSNDNNEPNRTVLSRSVRNALRRAVRNTGPISNINNTEFAIMNAKINGDNKIGTTTHEQYISLRKLGIFPSGAFDFSEVAFGAPILLSQPHFLNADPYYNDRLIGMKPNASRHNFYVDVEPITGSSIRTAIRLQINVALLKSPNVLRFRNFKENVFPVFWQEIDMALPSEFQTMLKMTSLAPNLVSGIAFCLCIIIGLSLFTCSVFIFAKAKAKTIPKTNEFIGHRDSIANENVNSLNGQPLDKDMQYNKFDSNLVTNMAYSTNVNHNNNDKNLSSFNRHKSKVIFTTVPTTIENSYNNYKD